jgi:NH3-dependent NAD+ synthetase
MARKTRRRRSLLRCLTLPAGILTQPACPAGIQILQTDEGAELMPYSEMDSDLLLLAAEDSDKSRKEAAERIRKMTPKERRDLRAACQKLDRLVEDTWLEESREKREWKL